MSEELQQVVFAAGAAYVSLVDSAVGFEKAKLTSGVKWLLKNMGLHYNKRHGGETEEFTPSGKGEAPLFGKKISIPQKSGSIHHLALGARAVKPTLKISF